MSKEATARIKINNLLEAAGWRFFGNGKLPASNYLSQKDIEVCVGQDLDNLDYHPQYKNMMELYEALKVSYSS